MLFFFAIGGAIQIAVEWLLAVLATLAPIIGITIAVVCAIAAVLSIVMLIVAARVLVRAKRQWVRVVGRVVIALEIVATLAFAGVAVIAVSAVAIYT